MNIRVFAATVCLLLASISHAEESGQQSEPGQQPFAGLNFGVGVSLTHDLGKRERISEATVVNGIVRVNTVSNDVPRVMLESHYFFTPDWTIPGLNISNTVNLRDADKKIVRRLSLRDQELNWGMGPFVALQPGSDNIIDAIGIGWMIGFKRNNKPDDHSSFNIGIGAVVDPSVKTLGSGIRADQPLPAGETDVRYRTTSQWGLLGLVSFAF